MADRVSIALPADAWAMLVVNPKKGEVFLHMIEHQLCDKGYGDLVRAESEKYRAELLAKLNEAVPGLGDKAAKMVTEATAALKMGMAMPKPKDGIMQ